MTANKENKKQAIIEQVKTDLRGRLKPGQAEQAVLYAEQYFQRLPVEDLLEETPIVLANLVASQLKFMRQRQPGQLLVRIFNPETETDGWSSTHTIIEMVNDDMPFLVDSAVVAMSELELGIHLIVHPVISIARDAGGHVLTLHDKKEPSGKLESIIQLQIDRQTEPEVLEKITERLRTSMQDVRTAVEDWKTMHGKAMDALEGLPQQVPGGDKAVVKENQDFLQWLADDHFIFLGCRDYEIVDSDEGRMLQLIEGSGLGILRETEDTLSSRPLSKLSADNQVGPDTPVIITKANTRSKVHRAGYMDYIGVISFDKKGRPVGERRFLGLFTSNAYNRSMFDTPLIRTKVDGVLERSNLRQGSHAWKSLVHTLESMPRDDLFQADVDELYTIGVGILNLQERQRVRLFIRREQFGRFYSCLVFIPRDHFNTEARKKIQSILQRALKGDKLDYVVQVSESVLARLQVIIRPKAGHEPVFDVQELEEKIVNAVRSWRDELTETLVQKHGEEQGLRLASRFAYAFPAAYQEDVSPWVAAFDVENAAALKDVNDLRMSLYRPRSREEGIVRFKLFKYQRPIPLSEVLPMLEKLGLRIVSERPYELNFADDSTLWVQDFDMALDATKDLNIEAVREAFQEAFEKTWRGVTESDGFNRLIIACQLNWRQVVMLRAYCKYLLQTGIPFSQAYMEETLGQHPAIARILVELFEALFNPGRADETDHQKEQCYKKLTRSFESILSSTEVSDKVLVEFLEDLALARKVDPEAQVKAAKRAFLRSLESVASLDQDRILRAFYGVIKSTLRTNFYQLSADGEHREYVSFKLKSSRVPDLPKPIPYREIWVYSPRVEGVHLRCGKVARGGLRWSDRREDFRTEVLGLMKAQNVKNTMIVPVGAKGGFVVKRMPQSSDRDMVMAEVVHCYRSFINGLLDITDNLEENKVLPPNGVVRRDSDDPYLVVAADKGTATFSDIANSVAIQHGFWLGDAFASGGSVGYDHKGMGITAKGAWEGVKRHFMEIGVDIQNEDFTVVGIGDMAGDVFGNGMLLSKHIRLKAAFNHMHIFLDPDPDAASSFEERERLFKLPRSSWEDYNEALISKGGGIFSRQAKTIPLSPEIKEWLGIEEDQLAPYLLIKELLKSEVDLLWNGGIGTYVKAAGESNADVGDLANNPLRINGNELRCKVVGEGGNLGCTQLGRIEYAMAGGRINTDFIDNSAGVDCSDHEVNIKILLNQLIRSGEMTLEERNELLVEMTDEVSDLVLRSNYLQTQTISMMMALTGPRLGAKQHFISVLEAEGTLDRELEFLPDDEELTDRRNKGLGLYRPELSVLLSYSKITLYQQLLDSDIPEDTYLSSELVRYFPSQLQERYAHAMSEHRLKREIIATQVTNSMVNRMGASFALRMQEDSGATSSEVAKAYTIAREIFDARSLWSEVEELDNKVDSDLQIRAMLAMWNLLRQATRWLLNQPGRQLDIQTMVDRLAPGLAQLQQSMKQSFTDVERELIEENAAPYLQGGFPEALGHRIASLNLLYPALDVVDLAERLDQPVDKVSKVYFGLGDSLGLKWLRRQVEHLPVGGQWHAHARGNLRDELYNQHRALASHVLKTANGSNDPVAQWIKHHHDDVSRTTSMLQDMRTLKNMDYATVSVAVRSLGQLLAITG